MVVGGSQKLPPGMAKKQKEVREREVDDTPLGLFGQMFN
jgi:hypothetical protein